MSVRGCVFYIWLSLSGGIVSPATSFSQPKMDTKEEVYEEINRQRTSRGLKPLQVDRKLARSAQSWAIFMPYKGRHNITFINRRRLFKSQVEREKIGGAEALAWGSEPVYWWLTSYRHAGIVLGPRAKRMGLGYWRGKWIPRTLVY